MSDEPEFDPSDYNDLSEAIRDCPGDRTQDVLDHFDPMVSGGHEQDTEPDGPVPLEEVIEDRNHNLNESVDKIRLKTQVKRGSGTRDQDTHDINVRGETPAEAAENLSECIAELEERDVFERVRELQNGGEDE